MDHKNHYPAPFLRWIEEQGEQFIACRLHERVSSRLSQLGPVPSRDALQARIDELDDIAHDDEGWVRRPECFQEARLLSAHMFLAKGDIDTALYEYYHSVEAEYSREVIEDITGARLRL